MKTSESTAPEKSKIIVKKSKTGLGLFASHEIKKGETIIEYLGNILNKEQCDAVKANKYLFEVNRNKTIDGSPRWNTARYVNHACIPNAEAENRKSRIFYVAKRAIHPGEEITVDYGEEYVNEFIKPYGCKCYVCEAKREAEENKNNA